MAHTRMSYGVLPTVEQFEKAFDTECESSLLPGQHITGLPCFRFVNDKRVGTCRLTCYQLWDELTKAHSELESGETDDADEAGDWCSCVLSVLGFEWI